MELDDLKQNWAKSNETIKYRHRDVLEIIQGRSEGPAAKLKRRFRKGMIALPLIASIAITKLSKKSGFIYEVFTWYLIGFCLLIMIYFYLNYRLISRMQTMEGDVKTHLQRQVRLLRQGLKWRLLITRSLLLVFFLLLEFFMYQKQDMGIDDWSHQSLALRLSVYAGVFLFFYFLTKWATDHRYKKHIRHLEMLTEQME